MGREQDRSWVFVLAPPPAALIRYEALLGCSRARSFVLLSQPPLHLLRILQGVLCRTQVFLAFGFGGRPCFPMKRKTLELALVLCLRAAAYLVVGSRNHRPPGVAALPLALLPFYQDWRFEGNHWILHRMLEPATPAP